MPRVCGKSETNPDCSQILCIEGCGFSLDLDVFGEHESMLGINAEAADLCLGLGTTPRDLHGAQIARLLLIEGCLRSAQRMCAVILRA